MIEPAKRIKEIPPYLFAGIEKKIAQALARGEDVISLSIGDPDLPAPESIIDALNGAARDAENHRYPSSAGLPSFRRAVSDYYAARFGVHDLDPETEVVALIGSKEGIANLSFCFIDPGDLALAPDPAYPVYRGGTALAGGSCYIMPLLAENGFLPDLDAIPREVAERARVMWLNYPNNPTGAVADPAFFEKAVAFARRYDILLAHDSAYAELTFDGCYAPSILQIPGAKEVCVEFGSCSKPFNMTGWRLGFMVGNAAAVRALSTYKSNVDSGVFQAVQLAGMAGLRDPQPIVERARQVYAARRDILVDGLNSLGWSLSKPKGTFYVWAPVPLGYDSGSFAEEVFEKTKVVLTPGAGFGRFGEGYFRAALTTEESRMAEAISRIRKAFGGFEF